MNFILVIGSGARESIIIKKIHEDASKLNEKVDIICIQTQENSFMSSCCFKIYSMKDTIKKTMQEITENIRFCIIGPEAPLEKQYADYFENKHIPCIGP